MTLIQIHLHCIYLGLQVHIKSYENSDCILMTILASSLECCVPSKYTINLIISHKEGIRQQRNLCEYESNLRRVVVKIRPEKKNSGLYRI